MHTLMLASMLVAAVTLTGCGNKAPATDTAATPASAPGTTPGTSTNTADAPQGGGEKLGPPASTDGGGEKLVEPAPTAG